MKIRIAGGQAGGRRTIFADEYSVVRDESGEAFLMVPDPKDGGALYKIKAGDMRGLPEGYWGVPVAKIAFISLLMSLTLSSGYSELAINGPGFSRIVAAVAAVAFSIVGAYMIRWEMVNIRLSGVETRNARILFGSEAERDAVLGAMETKASQPGDAGQGCPEIVAQGERL